MLKTAAGVALLAHLLALYLPASAGPPLMVPGLDKAVHLAVFAVPVLLLVLLSGRSVVVGAVFAGHAVLSEIVQATLVPGREGDPWDALFDLAGIGLGLLAAAWLRSPGPTGLR